jgi:DNA-binding CsgD family transcriptional regulator
MDERPLGLSARQYDCLKLASEHRTSKQIAAELRISPHTVDGHLSAAIAVLKVADRAAAARIMSAHLARERWEMPPEPVTGQSPPVEYTQPPDAEPGGQVIVNASPAGRHVTLGPMVRLGIIIGLAAASIFAIVLLLVASDVIARRQAAPTVPTTDHR